ncbi:MAG TPA: hypothetical protein VEU08_21905 [Vicinamibacterales bacterium]|nr:hypothetical protein [Vicinamibacterales bacterium]
MTPILVAAAIAALIAFAVFLWLRNAGGSGRRRQIEPLANGLERLRHAATRDVRRRPPGAADAMTAAQEALYESNTREMRDAGLSVLGDFIEEQDDGTVMGRSRWFVDGSGTISGWFGAIPVKNAPGTFRTLMLFFSETDAGQFVTTSRGTPELGLARPPTTHRQFLPWNDGIPKAIERHRSFVESVGGAGAALRRTSALDDVVALLGRQRAQIAAWRAAQPSEALLEADVRNVLRERYAQLGPEMLDYLRGR